MTLLNPDPSATDPLYNKIQGGQGGFPPDLCVLFSDRVEKLYEISHDLVDKTFKTQLKHDFAARYSELYFATVFRKRLLFNVSHPSDKGPDLFVENLNCWIEVVTMSDGKKDNPDSIPKTNYNGIMDYPQNQIILRYTNSFTEKAKKIRHDIENGIIKNVQSTIICISGGWLEGLNGIPLYIEGGVPQCVAALLAVGNVVIHIDKVSSKIVRQTCENRNKIFKKSSNEPVKTDYFLDLQYSHISGVIYSYANISSTDKILGNDFIFIHNPLADRPIPMNSINCGIEYSAEINKEDIQITHIEH